MDATISIIIPVYNSEKTITKCLESILVNTYREYQIILINDGSSDGSMTILEAYKKKYPDKIQIFDQENQGVARTRNKGLEYADSKYVMFIDHDDYVENDYLERFVTEAERNGCDMVIGGYRRTDGKKTIYEMWLQDVLWARYMVMAPWAKIYRREFLLKHGILFLDNNIGEDVYFNLQAINLTDRISFVDYCGYNWFYNTASVSNTSQKTIKSGINVMFLLDSCYDRLNDLRVTGRSEIEFYFIRYVVWYLLFIGRHSDRRMMVAEFQKIFAWLKKHFPKFAQNENISLFRPVGETLRNRVAVYGFILMYRLRLVPMFFRIYSKG